MRNKAKLAAVPSDAKRHQVMKKKTGFSGSASNYKLSRPKQKVLKRNF
jgi:hypothetical protein